MALIPDRPYIFLSYAWKDATEFADQLYKALTEAGFTVWMDRKCIPAGVDWDDALAEAIDRCAAFIYVMTPESVHGKSICRDELHMALDLDKPIIPLLLHEELSIPLRVRRRLYIRFVDGFSSGVETLSARLLELNVPAERPNPDPPPPKKPPKPKRPAPAQRPAVPSEQARVTELYSRLDRRSRQVVEALAVYGRPVPVEAVDFLLQPYVEHADSAPIFLRPGPGGTFDLSRDPCVHFDVEVRDDDSAEVALSVEGAPEGARRPAEPTCSCGTRAATPAVRARRAWPCASAAGASPRWRPSCARSPASRCSRPAAWWRSRV